MLMGERSRWSAYTLLTGVIGGSIGVLLQIPVGALLGSVSAVLAVNLGSGGKALVPKPIATTGRALIGVVLGSLLTPSVFVELRAAAVPAAILLTGLTITALLGGLFLARLYPSLDRRTALVASAPGGMSEMLGLGEELGAKSEVVLAFHLTRKLMTLATIIGIVIVLGV